jgi:hypothetical protein
MLRIIAQILVLAVIFTDTSIMNKSAKTFLIISGIYLFLLTFILLTQPQSGYSATTEQVLFYYLLFLPLWALTAVAVFISKKHGNKNWYKTAFAKKSLFWSIILFVIIGFALNFDYQRQVGCFVENEPDFSSTKFIFSIGSIILLSAGYYFSNNKFGISLLITEFALWTFKALYFNSSLDLFFPGYFTMTCWTLRLILIAKILNKRLT